MCDFEHVRLWRSIDTDREEPKHCQRQLKTRDRSCGLIRVHLSREKTNSSVQCEYNVCNLTHVIDDSICRDMRRRMSSLEINGMQKRYVVQLFVGQERHRYSWLDRDLLWGKEMTQLFWKHLQRILGSEAKKRITNILAFNSLLMPWSTSFRMSLKTLRTSCGGNFDIQRHFLCFFVRFQTVSCGESVVRKNAWYLTRQFKVFQVNQTKRRPKQRLKRLE